MGEWKPLSFSNVVAYCSLAITIILAVWTKKWWIICILLLILGGIIFDLIIRSPLTIKWSYDRKFWVIALVWVLLGFFGWQAIHERNIKSANISYWVESIYPGHDFQSDRKVRFSIGSNDERTLKAYVKITFMSDGISREAHKQNYYDGILPFIVQHEFKTFPGLIVPDEIIEKAKQRKLIQIQIDCSVRDENDELLKKRYPIIYTYNYDRMNWYLEQ
jgi:hypothetical protein